MPPPLRLLREAPIETLLGDHRGGAWEASGVVAHDGVLRVVFDNLRAVAVLSDDLAATGRLVTLPDGPARGFEDLTVDPSTGHHLLLVESLTRGSGWMARIEEFDDRFRPVSRAWLDFPLASSNKGFEGLACVSRAGRTYVLALCEGNWCARGKKGRTPGGGRIQVFTRGEKTWPHHATVDLPAGLPFADYSALAVTGDVLAVVSQESAAVWVGRLDPRTWTVPDDGVVHDLPRGPRGEVVYCSVEGVAWLGQDQLAMVSDRIKSDERDPGCRATQESVHVFSLS